MNFLLLFWSAAMTFYMGRFLSTMTLLILCTVLAWVLPAGSRLRGFVTEGGDYFAANVSLSDFYNGMLGVTMVILITAENLSK